MAEDTGFLKGFSAHGLRFTTSSDGLNYNTKCPFSGSEGKFVVNKQTGQWQSFTTGFKGNLQTFVEQFYDICLGNTKASDLQAISMDRKIPIPAFLNEIAFNSKNGTYLFPFRNTEGKVVNMSYGFAGKPMKRTAKLNVSLYGIENLVKFTHLPVYICEGEWDMLALKWLFKTQGFEAVVTAVPGANIFKDAWMPYFKDRDVYVCFDNDRAGYDGQQKVANSIRPIAQNMRFLAWPEVFKDKYDLRDFVVQQGSHPKYLKRDLEACLDQIKSLFSEHTKEERDNPAQQHSAKVEVPPRNVVEEAFAYWLKMESFDALAIMFGTYFANRLGIDPTWMFLVAPPGGSKSELLMTLSKSQHIETVSDLTPASLISGHHGKNGADPSMIPRLDKRVLIIKDFTVILEKAAQDRDGIFSVLRDAYDGYVEKMFATGIKKSYHSTFGIIAGVTPKIYDYSSVSTSLGERFLKYRIDQCITVEDERDRMRRAVSNIRRESKMRDELQDVTFKYLEKKIPEEAPTFTSEQTELLSTYAMVISMLRAPVMQDKFTKEMSMPTFREVGTRLSKQLHQLGLGICVHLDKKAFDSDVLRLLREVAISTCPEFEYNLVKEIYHATAYSKSATVTNDWITNILNVSTPTTSRLTSDLRIKNIIQVIKGDNRLCMRYRLNEDLEDLLFQCDIMSLTKAPPTKMKPVSKFRLKI